MGAKRLVFLSAFLALSWYTANADPIVTSPTVALGTDYFQTQPGTFFNFGPGIGIVNFVGLPIGPLSTDTSVTRLVHGREPKLRPLHPSWFIKSRWISRPYNWEGS